MNKHSLALVTALVTLLASAGAHAAVDITAATAGIGDAQTALLSLIGALMALSVAIFGIVKVYRFLSKRAGS